jgi:hypothetical protein
MNNLTTIEKTPLADFKTGVDSLIQMRDYFSQKILPKLKEGTDFYVIKGKKSLGKSGAEALAHIFGLCATFEKDTDTLESFKGVDGLVAYVCNLSRNNQVVGQGRGASTLKQNNTDPNKTLKMAQKSAFVDAVIRTTGLSNIFTMDLETMPAQDISPAVVAGTSYRLLEPEPEQYAPWESVEEGYPFSSKVASEQPVKEWNSDRPMTDKQRQFLTSLIL